MEITKDKITDIFCIIDDFCEEYDKDIEKMSLKAPDGRRHRKRSCVMSRSEIMTILVCFHFNQFRNFKHYYLFYVRKHLKDLFPRQLSYNRFVELESRVCLEMMLFLQLFCFGRCTGISFVDSTCVPVCYNKRITRNKVFKGYAEIGKSTTPANRIAVMLKEAGLGGCRQTVINWLQHGGEQLAYLLPELKDLLLKDGAVVNCDETWGRLRLEYKSGYKKVYVWCMVNKKERVCYYFFDKPKEGTRSREVLTQFLGDAKVKALQSDGYVGYVFLDDDIVDIDHVYCLAHVRAKFVTAYNIGKVNEAKPFIDWIAELYKLERHYKALGLTPEEIKQRRNDKETSKIINKMKQELDRLWPDDKQKQGGLDPVFATALRYLHNQWDGLMKYREDGEYSIDNNIAERNVRPFTVDRKNTMTFGSEEGIDCAATYHTIIQTCRMMGVKVLKYLQSFFKKFSEGCRDYAQMLPGQLAID